MICIIVKVPGRCVTTNPTKTTIDPEDLIVILGKKSLHSVSGNEKVYKIKSIILHENYIIKDGVVENDLAILVLREPADFNKDVGAACMFGEQDIIIDYQQTGTTAWSLSGDLTPIYFDKEKSRACNQENKVENTFCATYGDDVALCPSYGGLHATKHTDNKWYLHGIRTGDPTARRICVERDIKYTALINFIDWIVENIQNNKN
ncbi:coagulation factor X-like [Achroia grisella]|uniref:coagulation factor X-like n=1 Tax=Achroia grisella TaxID=688607 RepID=UPI0027D3249A|nr:coagulation factor X-like [Achroia grisella]